jgi:para-nitrobenzyl esterase
VTGTAESVRVWTGIPFADARRFGAPVPVPFDRDAPALQPGVAPHQEQSDWLDLGAPLSEDCLTLHVWSPPRSAVLKPVVVQLYGGGFEHGSNTSWVSDGSRLAAAADVVVVAPNYRVGAFGFLSLSRFGGPFVDASNLGLQDVVAAIEFVLEHAPEFGGDPDDVTVLGESAGGFLTAALAAVPRVRERIRRFAVFSAGASRLVPQATADETADRFLDHLGLRADPGPLLELPAAQVLAAQRSVIGTDIGRRNGPAPEALGVVLDAAVPAGVLDQHPADAVAAGAIAHANVLVSALTDEIASFRAADPVAFVPTSRQTLLDELARIDVPRDRAQEVLDVYAAAGGDLGDLRERLLTDYVYRLPAARLARAQSAAGGRAHLLLIGGADGEPAAHGSDVPALVGRSMPGATDAARARDERITQIVAAFVRDGTVSWDPVGAGVVAGSVGEVHGDATEQYVRVLRTWDGIHRP